MSHKILKFTKSERWGLIIWSIAILLISLSGTYLSNFHLDKKNRAILELYFRELDSMSSARSTPQTTVTLSKSFNPDTVSVSDLMKIGLSVELSERWVNFREYIKSYKRPEDLAKIYGMDSNTLASLLPYIEFSKMDNTPKSTTDQKSQPDINYENLELNDTSHVQQKDYKIKLDINQCTSKELEQMGFAPYVAKRIVKYRNSAGNFYDREELLKIYGIDTQQYLQVKENLILNLESLAKIDLNIASEETLKTLPGIGPSYAKRIIKFREGLGGFLNISQLREVYGIDETLHENLKPRLQVSNKSIRKIRINEISKDSLVKHPYVNWEQSQKIINFRKHNYPIRSLKDILSLNAEWTAKIEPYIDYTVRPDS